MCFIFDQFPLLILKFLKKKQDKMALGYNISVDFIKASLFHGERKKFQLKEFYWERK